MKALTIKPQENTVEEIEIEMQPNTVYTFFSSILIDELPSLDKHVVYTDANALSNNKKPFFLGAQLVVGDVLILGRNNFEDIDASIPMKDLKTLINYGIPQFYVDALALLAKTDINLYRTFEVSYKNEKVQLNVEWVLYTFNIADDATKEYFINELKKVIDEKGDVEAYIVKMAQIAINAAS